jgi:hypothetical protein
LVAQLTGAARQPLRRALAHGLRLVLAVNQASRASVQITIPWAQTNHLAAGKGNPKTTVVLLRTAQPLAAGSRTLTLKLSPAAARHLAPRGSLVLTVRVKVTDAAGTTVTRRLKIRLTR